MGNWDHAPWMIGGGVEHGVEVARLLAFAAAGGGQGIVFPTDLKVSARVSGGLTLDVAPGACVINNRSADLGSEAYVGRLPIVDAVTVAAGGGTVRYDMVIARVEDPFQEGAGWNPPAPADLQTAEYIKTVVVPNVPATARTLADAGLANQSGIPLALITVRANTQSILATDVLSLRKLHKVQAAMDKEVVRGTKVENLTQTAPVAWPDDIGSQATFDVPSWATHVSIGVVLGNVGFGAAGNGPGNNNAGWQGAGSLRCYFAVGGTNSAVGAYTAWSLDSDVGVDRTTLVTGGRALALNPSVQGRSGVVRVQGVRGSGNAPLIWDTKSLAMVDVVWHQAAT